MEHEEHQAIQNQQESGEAENAPPLSEERVEKKLAQLLAVSRLIDAPVESEQDWLARRACEQWLCEIDDELRSAGVRYTYSKKAGRLVRERYRLVIDGFFTEGGQRVACWTLIDTQAEEGRGAPVLVSLPFTQKAREAAHALALPLDPVPAFYSVPMRTAEERAQASELCERWNLVAAHLCPQCAQRFPQTELPEEEDPYRNRATLLCAPCARKAASQAG